MKKIAGFIVLSGVLLALVTAGGADSQMLTMERIILQSVISSGMMLSGAHVLLRGEKA